MAIKVLAPSLGEGVNELTIVKWLKQEGDSVAELDTLVEVETDKVMTEIPSPATGILLKIEIPDNETVDVGMVIAWIGQPGEKPPSTDVEVTDGQLNGKMSEGLPEKKVSENAEKETVPVTQFSGFISPVVARIAKEEKVDLTLIKGSGLGGRITKKDLSAFIETGEQTKLKVRGQSDLLVPHNSIRKAIAERMVLSKHTSPHAMTIMEADISKVVTHRSANKDAYAKDGIKLTFTPYFISAAVVGLKAYPKVNSSWSDGGLIFHKAYNIGMATSLGEDGLIVPVIKNADQLSLGAIARAVSDLSGRARNKELHPDEVKDGTFTVTNHGVSGSLLAMPIILQPQCGILGVGKIQKRPVVVTDTEGIDSIAIRPMVYLSFMFDHRILDGGLADQFLTKVVESLENWK